MFNLSIKWLGLELNAIVLEYYEKNGWLLFLCQNAGGSLEIDNISAWRLNFTGAPICCIVAMDTALYQPF